MTQRFDVIPSGLMVLPYFIIRDRLNGRNIAQSFDEKDAEFVAVKLNECGPIPNSYTLKPVMATQLAEFRTRMEMENGGALIDDPQIGLLLADLRAGRLGGGALAAKLGGARALGAGGGVSRRARVSAAVAL